MEIFFNEKGATFKLTKSTKVHKKWHGKIKFTFNENNATPKPTKFTKSNIKWLDKVEFIFNKRNIIPKPIKSTKVHPKMALVKWGSSSTILDRKHNMH
jgi:hypothetical protein